MCNKKSNKWAALKYMYLLPVGAFATVAFAHPEFTNRVDSRLGRFLPSKLRIYPQLAMLSRLKMCGRNL